MRIYLDDTSAVVWLNQDIAETNYRTIPVNGGRNGIYPISNSFTGNVIIVIFAGVTVIFASPTFLPMIFGGHSRSGFALLTLSAMMGAFIGMCVHLFIATNNKSSNQQKTESSSIIFTCKKCQQKLRIPKGKGKITTRCPKCSSTTITYT